MLKSWRLGRVFGFPVEINVSFLVLLALVFVAYVGLAGVMIVGLAFGSVLLHELGHALVARRLHVHVSGIELSFFGGDKPRAIVARAKPAQPLVELQAQQERLMRRMGIPPELRKFVPHVTLARLRDASVHGVAAYLGARALFARRFLANRFVLFSSRDSVGGGPYVVEAAYPLG